MSPDKEESLTEELRKRLDRLGKGNIPINKTMLWLYGIDKKSSESLAEALNDEMNQVQFTKNTAEIFFENDIDAKKQLMDVVRLASFTKEDYFSRGGMPENWFYNTPPVENPKQSNRILAVGTNSEIRKLYDIIEKQTKGESSTKLPIPFQMLEELSRSDIAYCSSTDSFWQSFFNENYFLDKEISIPKKIITTGYMRNYNIYGGETINCKARLEEIAQTFNLDIEFIPSFHP